MSLDDDLKISQKEKLDWETKEIKYKLKNKNSFETYFIPNASVIATLILGVFGSFITFQYNNTQIKITETKNEADIKISQINAALNYIKNMESKEIPEDLVQQAKIVTANIFPTETSFEIAVNELPQKQQLLSYLVSTHKKDFMQYLIRFLIVNPEEYSQLQWNVFFTALILERKGFEYKPYLDYYGDFQLSWDEKSKFNELEKNTLNNKERDEQRKKNQQEIQKIVLEKYKQYQNNDKYKKFYRVYFLLHFMEDNQLMPDLYNFLFSSNNKIPNSDYAMRNYFNYQVNQGNLAYYNIEKPDLNSMDPNEVAPNFIRKANMEQEVLELINKTKDPILRDDILISAVHAFYIFPRDSDELRNWNETRITEPLAKIFWENIDVTSGNVFESLLRQKILKVATGKGNVDPFSIKIKENLLEKILDLDFIQLSSFKIINILSKYTANNDLLDKNKIDKVLTKVLSQNYNKVINKELADFFSRFGMVYFSGDNEASMYQKKCEDFNCEKRAVLFISWYKKYWTEDWEKADMFSQISKTYPKFSLEINKSWY